MPNSTTISAAPDIKISRLPWALRQWRRWLPTVILVTFVAGVTMPGLAYRRWAWDFTEPGRFRGDITRNFNFGITSIKQGFLNVYENEVRDNPPRNKKLDYPPLRLLTFEAWAAWTQHQNPKARQWRNEYAFSAPLMQYYSCLEWLASLAALLIVRHWLQRCAQAEGPPGQAIDPWAGLWRAMMAFSLLWFDPGVAIIAHGWPSPNMWAIPFYLWAVLLCLWDYWFIAGAIMAIGAMLQGQQLFVAGIFVLWPLFAGRPMRSLRWISGFFMAFMLVASGWMLTLRPNVELPLRQVNWPAVCWVSLSLAVLVMVGLRRPLARRLGPMVPERFRRAKWLLPTAAVLVLGFPAIRSGDVTTIAYAISGAAVLAWLFWQLSWTTKRYLLALAAATCLLLCVPFFGAGTAWWEIGFLYGAERFRNVGGTLTANLPTLLQINFGWREISDVVFDIPAKYFLGWPTESVEVNIRQVLVSAFIILFLLAGVAIARQYRRRSPHLLSALVLPWVLFYTILPQMSPRYPVFIAGVGAICIGHSVGMSLLVLMFSALTVIQTALCMMYGNDIRIGTNSSVLFNGQMRGLFETLNPSLCGAVVVAACVFFWVSMVSVRVVKERGHPKL